jgi:hypothetical protein
MLAHDRLLLANACWPASEMQKKKVTLQCPPYSFRFPVACAHRGRMQRGVRIPVISFAVCGLVDIFRLLLLCKSAGVLSQPSGSFSFSLQFGLFSGSVAKM